MKNWFFPVPDTRLAPDEWPDLMVYASTILGEAAGEPHDGKLAVAYVIKNRMLDKRWPDDIASVCLQRLQFSCWNVGSPTLPRMFNPKEFVTEEVWNDCLRAAVEATWELQPDCVMGANHYLNPRSLRSVPSWARPDKRVVTIGHHEFFRL